MIDDYARFVDTTTSAESKNTHVLQKRLTNLTGTTWHKGDEFGEELEVARLLTAVIGLQSETGEFAEIVKKCIFQGKEFDESVKFHLKRELGDVLWYWAQGVMSLGFTPSEVIQENINKLEKRYPNGFETIRSEVRAEGDL